MIDKLFDETKLEFLKIFNIEKENGNLVKKGTKDVFIPIVEVKNDNGEYVLKSKNETLAFKDNYIKYSDTKVLTTFTVKIDEETGLAEGYKISSKLDYDIIDSHYDVDIDARYNKTIMCTSTTSYLNGWQPGNYVGIYCTLTGIEYQSFLKGMRTPPIRWLELNLENYQKAYQESVRSVVLDDKIQEILFGATTFVSYIFKKMSMNPIIYKRRFKNSYDQMEADNYKDFVCAIRDAYEKRGQEGSQSLEDAVGDAIEILSDQENEVNAVRDLYENYVTAYKNGDAKDNDISHTVLIGK